AQSCRMQPAYEPVSIPIDPRVPPAIRHALWRMLVPGQVMDGFDLARRGGSKAGFAQRLLEALNIRFQLDESDRKRIPATGALVIAANHPYGIVEGLILAAILENVRADWKIMVNSMVAGIAELRGHVIPVNPFDVREANVRNRAPLRDSVRLLASGGALVIFPAGEVAHLNLAARSITDSPWKTTAARLALRAHCPVTPVYFAGANSVPFHVAGVLHPGLRTIGLAHELRKLSGKTVHVHIGKLIPHEVLNGYRDSAHATAYMRSRTLFLANRSAAAPSQSTNHLAGKRARAIEPPGIERLLSEEVAALPAECELAESQEFAVYITAAEAIPRMLAEIGRCRELAFRAAGEGTGNETDLDRFDRHYRHLFLWSKSDRRLAGAYRLAVTTDVLPSLGPSGLYTSTLFRFKRRFFERLGPAIELGRSFVLPEYQKNYASLFLLWKGILRFVQRRQEAPVLFGAVSISQDYRDASRGLIATYLSDRASHELARMVAPRRMFRDPSRWDPQIKQSASLAADIEDLSLLISDIEDDGKGVPVLIRQYLKMGGRLLGFNVDPAFSHSLDALILADLRKAPQALLERCMGRSEAKAFLGL
ncbi:MAG TPA: GNAT family N-acyltransferase, partial [Candidatus Solibacter sp.]